MKKYLIIYLAFCAFLMTGCYSTVNVTSKERFDNTISSTTEKLNQMGYRKTGASTGKNTDITRSEGFVYMPNVGVLPYSNAKKNETTIDNYSFVNSNGEMLNYSVAYELKKSHDSIMYVENVNILGCHTNSPDNFELLCGDNSPIMQISQMENVDNVSVYNENKTYAAIFIPIIAVEVVLLVWLITLF